MSTLASTEDKLDNNLNRDIICYAFGCQDKSTEKIKVSAGTFGTITLNLCSKCVSVFQESKVQSGRVVI